MAIRKPLVLGDNGLLQQLQPGDTLGSIAAADCVGVFTNGETAATPLVVGTPVFISASGVAKRAQANAANTAAAIGLWADVTTPSAGSGNCAVVGILTATTAQWDAVTNQVGGLVFGSLYYLDPTNVGHLTTTVPTAAGQFRTLVGQALSTTSMRVMPQFPVAL